jgi:glycosyltransferase involved in cell wall biosynthesis
VPDSREDLVSVIVTTRNSGATIEACLRSVRAQTYPRVELIVVDNHSTDATPAVAQGLADRLLTLGPERSAQRNHGAEEAAGDFLLFIDSDMILSRDVLADCVAALRESGLPAAMVPEETVGEGFWTHCRILERSCYVGDDTVEAARFYTRQAFVDAGGFGSEWTGAEDWDLSRRVAQGRRLPRTQALIRHDEGRIRLRTLYRKRRYYGAGYLRYLREHGGGAAVRANPLLRGAYVRNWRRLAEHPLLTAGMISLKFIELIAVLQGALEQSLPKRSRTAPS